MGAEPKLLDGGFDQERGDFAAAPIGQGVCPGGLCLFGRKADQGSDLAFVLRFLVTIGLAT